MNLKKKIGLGTVQFGMDYGISNVNGKTTKQEAENIVRFAENQGIDTLDTALAYGVAEEILGSIGVGKFKIVSKFLPPHETNLSITQQLQNSLNKLNTNSLHAYLAHRPKDVLKNPSQWNELKILKEKEQIKKIGFSLNEPGEIKEILRVGILPDIVQAPYNYLDRRYEETMKELHSQGCEIHSRSTFLQGLFFRNPETLHNHFDSAKEILREIRDSSNNLAASLLQFSLRKNFIDKVIIGAETKLQLEENISGLNSCKRLSSKIYNISNSILVPSQWP